MGYSFLIVDDERLSRRYISNLISEFDGSATIFEASSALEALAIIEEKVVDVLFLDVKMPQIDGFGFLDMIKNRSFELIFITAYDEYAIKAIREGAVDYLLKPIRKSEFRQAIQNAIAKRRGLSLTNIERTDEHADHYLNKRLTVNHSQGIRVISLKDIVYLKADNTYTTIHLDGGETFIASKALHRFEKILEPPWFFRIHKSHIINMHHLREYSSEDGPAAIMDNNKRLFISRYRLSDFLETLNSLTGERKL